MYDIINNRCKGNNLFHLTWNQDKVQVAEWTEVLIMQATQL
jgi:hypothetical protein